MTDKLGKRLYKDSLGSRMRRTQQGITKAAKVQRINSVDELTSSLGLLESGEFRVGNNTSPGSGFTGVRMVYPGEDYGGADYNLAGVNNDVLQWGGRVSDGVFVAGAGKVILDVNGVTVEAFAGGGISRLYTYKFVDASDNNVGYFGAYYSTTTECTLDIQTNPLPSRAFDDSHIYLRAVNKTGANIMTLRLDGEASDAGFELFTAHSVLVYSDTAGEAVFNEGGRADIDTRFETGTYDDMLLIDSGADRVKTRFQNYPIYTATVAAGVLTPIGTYTEVNGQGAAADSVTSIAGTVEGDIIICTRGDADITFVDGGNINLDGNVNFVLNGNGDKLVLINRNGTQIDEISRSNN